MYSQTRYIMMSTETEYTIALKDDVYNCDNYTQYLTDEIIMTFDVKKQKPIILWCANLFGFTHRSQFNNWITHIAEVCVDMSYGENDNRLDVWDN